MKRALFIAAAAVAASSLIGCEAIVGIHERELASTPDVDAGSDAGTDAAVCPEGMGDCDGIADNGCEAELTTDVKNCGACAHDCRGDGCAASACIAVVMADNEPTPEALAVSAAGLFWTNQAGLVRKLPLEGGNVQTIGDPPAQNSIAFAIALSDQSVFWTLFQTMPADVKPGVVMRATLDGVNPAPIFMNQHFPAGIAVDATTVYWAGAYDDTIYSGPSNGGSIKTLATVPGGSEPFDLAADKTDVYWTNYLDGTIVKVPKVQGASTKLAKYQDNPLTIAVNDKGVYWTNLNQASYKEGSVWMTPKDSPAGTDPILVAELQYAPSGITADETAVYWAILGHDVGVKAPGTGAILKMPLDADGKPLPNTQPIVVAAMQNSPTTVRVYDHILYWTTGASGGEVFRMVQ